MQDRSFVCTGPCSCGRVQNHSPTADPDNLSKGTPAFMSIDVANVKRRPHVHSLEDDLESILYVVLYCTLRWLPVHSSTSGLDWWLTQFFGDSPGWPPASAKRLNALTRCHTETLEGRDNAGGQAVLDWMNATMDLHYFTTGGSSNPGPNPLWKDGEALGIMWKEALANDLPDNDRTENSTPNITRRVEHSLHATCSTSTTSAALFDSCDPTTAKRSVSETSGTDNNAGSFNRNSNRRRRSSDSEGGVETRGKKLRRAGSG